MLNDSFKEILFRVAAEVKEAPLTSEEKDLIVKYFDASAKTTSAEKAREAVEKVVEKKLDSGEMILEKASTSAHLDNLEQLLRQMDVEADKLDK